MSRSGIFLVLIVTMGLLVLPVTAFQTPESIIAAGNVYVSNVTFDPGSFFTDDSGTVTVYVTNGNADQSVVVNHVTFGDKDLRLTSSTYDSTTNIGPLQNLPFVFSVSADAPEGTYYPTFSLSFRDADSLHFRAVIRVDNTPLELTIVDKPDAFTREKKKTIFVQVANPRKNDVRNVILEVSGTGITASPDKIFIGNLATGAKIPVNFTVTPGQETDLILALTYNNGNNPHKVTTSLPIAFGIDKMQADPVISNIMVTSSGGIYHITGDVNNAGLETANTVTVTSLSPAVPQDPYKTYVVGALKPDDFGSFEVTFTADGVKSVPLRMSYKDADGNIIDSRQDVTLTVTGPEQQQDQSILLPVFAIVVVIALAGGYLYYRRKKNQ
jgi:catechol 2,3-dioxygenase-like lactoylglutathione lyase family enzyme